MTTPSVLLSTLKDLNSDPRDANLLFDEPTHKYTITCDASSQYTSVTTWNHSHFPHFDADDIIEKMQNGRKWNSENKYWGMSADEIKALWAFNAASVSGAGTALHFDVECFMNMVVPGVSRPSHKELLAHYVAVGTVPNDSDEWQYFLQFVQAFPSLVPYRTEWMIYDEELKLAGSIDMVYEDPNSSSGDLLIYDWKRAKEITKTSGFGKYALTECIEHLPDTNYWHYSLQLNTYKAILESKYGKKVNALYLVRLHPNNVRKTFDLIKCADLSGEIGELFEHRRRSL